MSDLSRLLDGNQRFTKHFVDGELPIRPRLSTIVLTDLAVINVLAGLPNGKATTQELVIVHHTDCGMSRFADPGAQQAVANRLGIRPDQVAQTMAITNPAQSVRDDIARLSRMPGSETLVVSGLVYDTTHGTVEEIVAPTTVGKVQSL